jgi:hypothetical protein
MRYTAVQGGLGDAGDECVKSIIYALSQVYEVERTDTDEEDREMLERW